MKRSGPLKRTPMKKWRKPKRTAHEASMSMSWHDQVLAALYPLLQTAGGDLSVPQAHHVILQQTLRARARALDLPESLLVWDTRVGMKVSARRHARHHSGHEPITRVELELHAPDVFGFAREYGLEAWLDRHYPVMCPDCKHPVATHEMYRSGRCPVVVFRPTV